MSQRWKTFVWVVGVLGILVVLAWPLLGPQLIALRFVAYDVMLGERLSDVPGPDHAPNMFGSYDHVATRDAEIAFLREVVANHPQEPTYRYLLAGALMRCLSLVDARANYEQYARETDGVGSFAMLATIDWLEGDAATAQRMLDLEHRLWKDQGVALPQRDAATVFGNMPRDVGKLGTDKCSTAGARWPTGTGSAKLIR